MAANGSRREREAQRKSGARRTKSTRGSRPRTDRESGTPAQRSAPIVRNASVPRRSSSIRAEEREGRRSAARSSARRTSRPATRKRRANEERQSAAASTRRRPASSARQPKRRKPTNPLLPLLALIVAFAAAVLVFRMGIRPSERALEAAAASSKTQQPVVMEDPAEVAVEEYKGVEDPWVDTLLYTTGNEELDQQVKAFCDALSKNKDSAEKNAQAVWDVIVQSEYEPRTENEMPSGSDWTLGAAHHYFVAAKPKEGVGGKGDYYEFAAVAAYCLQYFGYKDALATPIVSAQMGGQIGSALVLVSDFKSNKRVCDPYYNVNGWMLEASAYKSIVVDDIGEDLTPFEERGLSIRKRDASTQKEDSSTNELTGTGSYSDANTG